MQKVWIVEDDMVIAKSVKKHLEKWGYEAEYVTEFQGVLPAFLQAAPQLVLLDISLPFMNGYHWCSEIRKHSKVPIIFISSAADNMNIVMAMNMGADDFIAKPFDLNVLSAKVGALMRRAYSFAGQMQLLTRGDVVLHLNDATLSYGTSKAELTKNEFRILQLLMEQGGQVVSREAIMLHLWESDSFIDDNTLTVNMTRLRKRLEEIGLSQFIITKKGLGYMVM